MNTRGDAVAVVTFESFRAAESPVSLRDYLRLKYEIFGREFAWPIRAQPGTDLAEPDPFDPCGHFVVARAAGGEAVGCARVTALQVGFPHQDLLLPLLARQGWEPGRCATLNAVAVAPAWRARSPLGDPARSPRTIAARMVLECHGLLQAMNLSACVLTTTEIVAERFFTPLGYVAAGQPFASGLYSAKLLNMYCEIG